MTITVSVCDGCGRAFIPTRKRCPVCGGTIIEHAVPENGELLSFTCIQAVPDGFTTPLSLAIAGLGYNAKLLCESRCKKMIIGMKVSVKKENEKYYCLEA